MTIPLQNVAKSDIRKSNLLDRCLNWFRSESRAPAWTRSKTSIKGFGVNVVHEREKLTTKEDCVDGQ